MFDDYDGIVVGILTRLPWHTHQELPNAVILQTSEIRGKDYAKPGSKAIATDFLNRVKLEHAVHADLGPMISSQQLSAENEQPTWISSLEIGVLELAHWPSETLAVVRREMEFESSLRSADVRALSFHIL